MIKDGPLEVTINSIGKEQSENAIVIGVRSQLSSVEFFFDTLMERAFAETLNLRLRLPKLVMGEVYLLPVVEYDDQAMKENRIAWNCENGRKQARVAARIDVGVYRAVHSGDAKEKSLFIFHARIALKSLILLFVRLIARGARIGKTHTQTDTQTDRQKNYCNPRRAYVRTRYVTLRL